MDLPVAWQEALGKIDIAKIEAKVQDFAPAVSVLRETWSKETLADMSEGKLFVPDDVINNVLKERIAKDNSPLKELTVASHGNGVLDLNAVTAKGDKILLAGIIEEFSQKDGAAKLVYRVKKHKLPGHGLTSWIFSNVSLAMAQRLFGKVEIKDDIPLTVKHNTVTIDLSETLKASKWGTTSFMGQNLLDMVQVEGAKAKEGGIELDTKLNVSDDVKATLRRIVTTN